MNGEDIFTPRKSAASNERYTLKLNPEDQAKIPLGCPWSAVVTDLMTGRQYHARGAECSQEPGCFCDAIAEPMVQPRTETIYRTIVWPAVHLDLDGVEPKEIVEPLRDSAAEIARALAALATPRVELVHVDSDKRGAYRLFFKTTDEHTAKTLDFNEMLRPDAEDFEPTPWAVEA